MATVFDVAQYILSKYPVLDAMKLQKLVYYSQAWHVVQRGYTLFDEPVKAYEKGPVVGMLFYRHKKRRWVTPEVIGVGSKEALSLEETELLESVLAKYAPMTADELSELTHRETPWQDARAMKAWDDTIQPGAMKAFYSAQLVYEPSAAPVLKDMWVTYVRKTDLTGVLASIEEPDDISGFLRQITKAKARIDA